MISTTDADHHTTTYGYDLDNRPTSVLAPDGVAAGKTTTSVYDGLGDITGRTDPNGHATTYTYDPNHRPTGYTTPTGQKWTAVYDLDGNVTSTVTGKGNVAGNTAAQIAAGTITAAHDTLDRPTSTSYGDGTPTVSWTYDTASRITTMTDGAGSQTRGYDNANRLTNLVRTPPSGPTQSYAYTYDADSDITSRTLPDTTRITYGYDTNDRPSTLTADGASTTYGYDAADELTSATLPTATGTSTAWAYDAAGRLTGVDNERRVSGATSPTSKYVRGLDAAGNPLTLTTTRGSTTRTDAYTYDPVNRLTAVCYTTSSCSSSGTGSISWAHDLVGNRTGELRSGDSQPAGATGPVTTTSSYDASDQLTQAVQTGGQTGTTSYGYDANGNQTTAGTRSSVYDLANQLTSATVGGTTTSYTYDGWNDRRSATTGSATTTYSWDPNNSVDRLAVETAGSTVRSYRYAASGAPASYTSTGTTGPLYDLTDDQHNVSDLLNNTGNAQWAYTYEPYGAARTTTKVSSTAPTNLLGYTGAYTDPATGLLDLRARQYDTATGTFGGRDPLGQAAGTAAFNTFQYAGDTPLTRWDPSGRWGISLSDAGDFAAGFGDAVTFGGTRQVRNLIDIETSTQDYTNYNSAAYAGGAVTGTIAETAVLPGGGALADTLGVDSLAGRLATDAAVGSGYGALSNGLNAFQNGECLTGVLGAAATGAAGGAVGALSGAVLGRVIRPVARDIAPLPIGVRTQAAAEGADTELVQRAMSRAELDATEQTGLVRGGREGTSYVSDNVNSNALRARQRLALPQTPEVRVTLEVPRGAFSRPKLVDPNFDMPGGGMERMGTGQIACRIVAVLDYC